MKGTIVERPKGSRNFCIRYSAGKDPATGKYRQIWESGFASPKEAKKRLTELEYQRNNNTLPKGGKTTVAEYLNRWIKDYAQGNLSPATLQGYESIIRQHLAPSFASVPLVQLGAEDIQRFYSQELAAGLSSTTINHFHTCLHRALKMALQWGLIGRNPADAVSAPRIRRNDMQTMGEDDLTKFLEAARSTDYYCLFYVALMTGARRGELLALRWSDVDLLQAEVHVNRNMLRLKDHSIVYKAPKTAKGRRMISLSPSTCLVLRRHKEEAEAIAAALKKAQSPDGKLNPDEPVLDPDSLVFCHVDGSALLPDSISQAWRRLIQRTGLKHIRLHDARHTHASLLLSQNVHPKVVQERLGHATISTTLDLYSHVTPNMQQAAAAKLDKILHHEKATSDL